MVIYKQPKKDLRSAFGPKRLLEVAGWTVIITPLLYRFLFRRLMVGPEIALSHGLCIAIGIVFAKQLHVYVAKYQIEHVERAMFLLAGMVVVNALTSLLAIQGILKGAPFISCIMLIPLLLLYATSHVAGAFEKERQSRILGQKEPAEEISEVKGKP